MKTASRAGPNRPQRLEIAALGILIAVVAVLDFAAVNPSLGWGGDTAMYIMHAINIVNGDPYNATRYIQNPYSFLGPQAYPPGLPLLLAPVYAVFGLDIYALNAFVVCLFIITLVAMVYHFRDQFPGAHGNSYLLALIALTGLNPAITELASKPLTDIPFLLLLLLSLIALNNAYKRIELSQSALLQSLVVGGCIYLAISTRILGVVLFPMIVFYDLSRYRRLTTVSFAAIPLSLLLLGAQELLLSQTNVTVSGPGNGYAEMMGTDIRGRLLRLPEECLKQMVFYAKALHAFWTREEDNLWITPFLVVTLLLALIGFGYRLATRYTVQELFPVFYMMALLPWSAAYWRYLIPVVPFYFFYMLIGLAQLQRLLKTRYPVLLVTVLLIACIPYTSRYAKALERHADIDSRAPNSAAAFAMYQYIEAHTDADDVIIFLKPRILTLFTGRYASTFTYAPRPALTTDQAHLRYFQRINASYALAGPPDHDRTIEQLAQRRPEEFRLIHTSGPFRLYRVESEHSLD